MHTFTAALAGLSITSGISAPLITNQVQDSSNISLAPTTQVEKRTRIPLNGQQKISTNQNSKIWTVEFDLKENTGSNKGGLILFEGGGLRASVGWGSTVWNYDWWSISVNADLPKDYETLIDEHHVAGLAHQYTELKYSFGYIISTGKYYLSFYFYTQAIHSLTESWGNLVIGDALIYTEEL